MRKREIKDDVKEVNLSNWMGDGRLKEEVKWRREKSLAFIIKYEVLYT